MIVLKRNLWDTGRGQEQDFLKPKIPSLNYHSQLKCHPDYPVASKSYSYLPNGTERPAVILKEFYLFQYALLRT